MNQLTNNDLAFVLSRVPNDIREVMKKTGLALAGGFIRATIAGEKPSDLDLFGESEEKLSACAYKLAAERKGRVHKTDNAITVLSSPRLPIQFITRWLFPAPIVIIPSFDFTVCQAVIWWAWTNPEEKIGHWCSATSEGFYPDLAARRLVYTCPERNEDAGGSILRVRKFLARGYNIQAQSLARAIARLVMGVREIRTATESESWVGDVLTALLREVDPLTVVDGIEIVDEHQVQNQ